MRGNFSKKVDYLDCKIIAFEVIKRVFFCTLQNKVTNFEFSWLKIFALYKVEIFYIMFEDSIENPLKNR